MANDISSILKATGLSQSDYDGMSPNQQAAFTVLGGTYLQNAKNNSPIPATLSQKEMNKLWKQAQSDPTINQYYANELKQGTEVMNMSFATDTEQFQTMTREQQQKYVQDKMTLDSTAAKYGQVYSGIRGQAKATLDASNTDTIESTTMQLKNELNTLGSEFEAKYGSAALAGTSLAQTVIPGGIGSFNGVAYNGPGTEGVGYTPMGGVAGTQASAELSDQLNEQSELAQDKLQGNSLKNFKYNMLPPGETTF